MKFAISGPRKITTEDEAIITELISHFIDTDNGSPGQFHIGDALGVDAIALKLLQNSDRKWTIHKVEGKERWHFADRTKKMINSLGKSGRLYAFPNKPCPNVCKPSKNPNGGGSGTWLAIAYAHFLGLEIWIYPIGDFSYNDYPDWLKSYNTEPVQLTLFDL